MSEPEINRKAGRKQEAVLDRLRFEVFTFLDRLNCLKISDLVFRILLPLWRALRLFASHESSIPTIQNPKSNPKLMNRKGKGERAAFAGLAFHPNLAAVHFDKFLG